MPKTCYAKKILLATFSLWLNKKRTAINGMVEPMLSFFLPKVEKIDLIDGPHPGSDTVISRYESYRSGVKKKSSLSYFSIFLWPILKIKKNNTTQIIFKIRDFLSVFEWVFLRSQEQYDLFIGLESIYTLAGIFLKKLKKIKTVVYYVSDYSPNRYPQKWFNTLYIFLDRFCAQHADFIWDVSQAIHPARIKAGLNPKYSARIIHVPNALFPYQISPLPNNQIQPYALVYAGTLGPENGPDLAIKSLPLIIREFPQTKLHIIGGNGSFEKKMKAEVKKYKLEENVIFHGFINNFPELSQIINHFMIGLAPYRHLKNSARRYGDATKIRLYLAASLPVITTSIPPLGNEISQKGAALITEDTKEKLAKAVIRLFSDKELYQRMRSKAREYAKKNTWENSYKKAFSKMKIKSLS